MILKLKIKISNKTCRFTFIKDLVPVNTPIALKMDVQGYECKVNN